MSFLTVKVLPARRHNLPPHRRVEAYHVHASFDPVNDPVMPPGLEEGATGYEVTVRVIEVVIQAPSFTYQHTQDGYYVDYTLGVIWNGKKYYTVEWWEDSSVSVTADVIEGIGLPPEQCDRGSKTGFTTGTASAEWILEDSERKYTISGGRRRD